VIRYQITDGTFARDPKPWFAKLRSDVDYIQIRERDLNARDLAALTRRVLNATSVPVLVNDRIDIAIACGAAGVHLRADSNYPARIKELAPLIVSVAIHNEGDLEHIGGADFAILAPVFHPRSKPDTRPPLGLETLHRVATASSVPVIALGGITDQNALSCIQAGAAGVAGITLWSS